MSRIFLSHSSKDRAAAEEIVEFLEAHGLETWYSKDDIHATDDWERSIRTALEDCGWFVLLLSKRSVASKWVRAEVHWAFDNRDDHIVPVLLEPCEPAELHLMLPTIQHVDFVEDQLRGRQALLDVWKVAYETAPDRFRLVRPLGKGGMGQVTLEYDEGLGRNVAIKRMLASVGGRASFRRRFLQEARDSAALNHPNIVPILSIGGDDEGPFLVLEYMDGGTLQDRLREGKMGLRESLAYMRQLLEALKHAHEKGVIHRDIKPQNVLLTGAGVPKLSDFGLAWVVGQDDRFEGDTREGTPRYLAPELSDRNEMPNPRTDLYALGLTFYQMLTGRSARRVKDSEVPASVLPFLAKLIHENPNLRYPTAADALKECLDIERSLELAERTEEKTRARMAETVEAAFEHCAGGRLVDAEAALSRVISEDPNHFGAVTGLLVLKLAKGDMSEAARLYTSLLTLEGEDPAFTYLSGFLGELTEPTRLVITPLAMPYSYRLDGLRQSRLTKELVRFTKETINLGDVGELLVDLLSSSRSEGSIEYSTTSTGGHMLRFGLEGVDVTGEFDYVLSEKRVLRARQLEAIRLSLTIEGEPFPSYRLVRYLLNNLTKRFKRPVSEFVVPNRGGMSAADAQRHVEAWQRFDLDFARLARSRLTRTEMADE